MARIEGMSGSRTLVARLAFFLSRRSYGRVITPARVYALDSRLLLALGLMEEVQEWAKQTRAPVKQLARMLVAWHVGCPWCLDFGTNTSQKLGVTDEQLRALPDYEHSSLFSEEERAVLRYADTMTRTPVRVSIGSRLPWSEGVGPWNYRCCFPPPNGSLFPSTSSRPLAFPRRLLWRSRSRKHGAGEGARTPRGEQYR
jgi:AhpD family alkylhydroperoxidase